MQDQLLGGRYRLVRQLGEGGMGQVWEAQDETLGRRVAVKVISLLAGGGSHGTQARARFLREARITAQLQHPNIVTIHDLGETNTGDTPAPFLVMELVRGEGLDALLRRGAVTLTDAAHWGAQICDALADAHDAGIMHRDIKPSNIIITPSGAIKVLDFGIARAADPYATTNRLTQTGFIVGTPPYMAPEQARGLAEPRSDLYALGCLLFELITGQLPFQAPDTVGYLSAHLTQDPPAPSSVSTGIPPAWDDLALTLLHKDPNKRYPNAHSLAQALRRLDQTHVPSTVGTSRILVEVESRAALLTRLATAMRAAHDITAAHIPYALSHTRLQRHEASGRLTTPVQPPASRTRHLTAATTPQSQQPTTKPQPLATNGPFEAAWTGKEPLDNYTEKLPASSSRRDAIGAVALAAVAVALIAAAVALYPGPNGSQDDRDRSTAMLAFGILFIFGALFAARTASRKKKFANVPEVTPGWTLHVGPNCIVTTGATGRREFTWDQIKNVTVTGLRGWGPYQFRVLSLEFSTRSGWDLHIPTPAGWPYPQIQPRLGGSPLRATPVCVLGPMTHEQRTALQDALSRYGDGKRN
ncbi:serine/threonine-protein kinase [Streptomyces sp. NPDC056975]|uniref:serine/threonine-protein kinase n=1 Tax=Streptomyces sp. NPDC056975 TaxID=3345985 RepID=UPI0036320344